MRACSDGCDGMLIVFTDLDGTLLDAETYSFEAAREALCAIRSARIPLVLSTSKTRAELRVISSSIGFADPWIAENGAVVSIPTGYFPFHLSSSWTDGDRYVIRFGCAYEETVGALRSASRKSDVPVMGFSDLNAAKIAELTGMPLPDAMRAKEREHDEPFLILGENRSEPLLKAIEALGKTWTRGGRFYHISDPIEKGTAVRFLRDQFQKVDADTRCIGLGDALNDVSLLAACDVRVILPSRFAEEMQRRLPTAVIAREPGPVGWNQAILAFMQR